MNLFTEILLPILAFSMCEAVNYTDENVISQCKMYRCESGYNYVDYFMIDQTHKTQKEVFTMRFAVMGSSNFHFLMSTTEHPPSMEPLYELVVGAGDNKYTELRRMRKRYGKAATLTPGILSTTQYSGFWIKFTKDGVFKFGRENSELAIISYKDSNPVPINYFSFASWEGVDMKVLYDCNFNGSGSNDTLVVKEKSFNQKLRDDLFKDYDTFSPRSSDPITTVAFEIHIKSVSYDALTSLMTVQFHYALAWEDSRLVWNPEEYGNLTQFLSHYQELWIPYINIYNTKDWTVLLKDTLPTVVNYDGQVMKRGAQVSNIWCSSESLLAHWPQDSYTCSLLLGFYQHPSRNLRLEGLARIDTEFSPEWDVISVGALTTWFSALAPSFQDSNDSSNCQKITLEIVRKPTAYNHLMYAPFVGIAVLMLSTLHLSYSPVVKMSIMSALLVFSTISLYQTFDKLPIYTPNLPHIVIFYLWAIASSWSSLVMSIFIFKFRSQSDSVNIRVENILSSKKIMYLLGLDYVQRKASYAELAIDENETDINIQYWEALEKALDRILFSLYFTIYSFFMLEQY